MHKTITSLIVICTFALCARGADGAFTTGTSFEKQKTGLFDYRLDDQGEPTGITFWTTTADTNGMYVIEYGAGDAAYDYAARGMTRNPFFDAGGATNAKYLGLGIEDPLERCIEPLQGSSISNVMVNGGIYSDTLARFTTSYSAPAITNIDKIAVWLREREMDDGTRKTNLVITAGSYAGDYNRVVAKDYLLTNTVAEGVWCRLTVRAISDITVASRQNASRPVDGSHRLVPGFTVYIDGKPAVVQAEGYDIGWGYREDLMSPEARVLRAERRLFPWLVNGDENEARSLSRFAFAGQGAVDDVLFSSESPDYVVADNVFTLRWDHGVKTMTCIVSNAAVIVTNHIDTALLPQYFCDYPIGASHWAQVTVTNVVYDAAHEYTNGVWTAENDCTVTDLRETSAVFVYDGDNANPVGVVVSSRDVIGVGTGGYETFSEAKQRAREKGVKELSLNADFVITFGSMGSMYSDQGRLAITNNEDFVLDLNGHTLQGRGAEDDSPTIDLTGGKLKIVDSVGGGAVLPPANGTVAVKCRRIYKQICPELVIGAGRYAGEVRVSGLSGKTIMPECAIGGGSFTNFSNSAQFYLEQYVTNTALYYSLDDSRYWSVASDDAFIWTGDAGKNWTAAGNWKRGEVPGEGDLAVFPHATDGAPWDVDFGEGVVTKRFWMDGDVAMSGMSDFSRITVESGDGCFVGSGTMTFTNALPGRLTTDGSNGVRLGADWKGTVKISKIGSAKVLSDIDYWGVVGSKVEFAGVRGYVKDKSSHALAYGLVLTDDGDTSAWKNETGYTGSTISFPKLSGDGTFESPRTVTDINQVFRFGDVTDFTGAFKIGSKKLLLGSGGSTTGAKTGSFTFANGVKVRSGLDWSGVTAYFGRTLNVAGAIDDVLMAYSGDAPSVEHVFVTLCNPTTGVVTTNTLIAADNLVTIGGVVDVLLDGNPASASELDVNLRAGRELTIVAGSAIVELADGRLIVNGRYYIPEYYRLTPLDTSSTRFAVSFDKTKATPSLADFAVSSEEGYVVVNVTNAKPGLWYGLRSVSSLAESFEGAEPIWLEATDDTVTFEVDAPSEAAFYQVIVTDVNPY